MKPFGYQRGLVSFNRSINLFLDQEDLFAAYQVHVGSRWYKGPRSIINKGLKLIIHGLYHDQAFSYCKRTRGLHLRIIINSQQRLWWWAGNHVCWQWFGLVNIIFGSGLHWVVANIGDQFFYQILSWFRTRLILYFQNFEEEKEMQKMTPGINFVEILEYELLGVIQLIGQSKYWMRQMMNV